MEDHRPAHDPKAEAILRRWPMIVGIVLFIVVTTIAMIISQHARVLADIEARGGKVVTEPGRLRKTVPDSGQKWLQNKVGADWIRLFERVTAVDLSGTPTNDNDLIPLKAMTSLEVLYLGNTQVSDAGLIHLKAMTSLKELSLYSTQVSDAGLIHLKAMTSLGSLVLHNTQVSDAGLPHLKAMTNLKWLYLNNTQVSDAGVIHLKAMTSLRWLTLKKTQVSDAGVKQLRAALPGCKIFH